MNQELRHKTTDKVRRILEFLKQFQTLKKPPIRNIDEYSWKLFFSRLPRHPAITVGQLTAVGSENEVGTVEGLILRVRRPRQTLCPSPPDELVDWILSGWSKIENEAEFVATRNITVEGDGEEKTQTIRFEDDPKRLLIRDEWLTRRQAWVVAETPARQVENVYQRLYTLHGELERESENVQLMLGDGLIRAADVVGRINHPVLLQRLELQFDPSEPEFRLVETDDPPELAMAVVSGIQSKDGQLLANVRQLAQCQSELGENRRIHPLGDDETKGFLARLVNGVFAKGHLCESDHDRNSTQADVTLQRDPLVFLSPRVGSFSTAIEAAIARLTSVPDFQIPNVLSNLVGEAQEPSNQTAFTGSTTPNRSTATLANATLERELLLTRPANPEQEQVIRQLDESGMVLVQGPPGTGKTHTIANLVGHALAQGKTVLITSHSAKALRVVREKIVEELRPLCVSVLDADAASRRELKEAITAIGERLGTTTQEKLDDDVANLRAVRSDIARKLKVAQDALSHAVRDEYVDVIVGGEGTNPAEAARHLREWNAEHSWLPGPVEMGTSLPLPPQDVTELYASNAILTPLDEEELAHRLPDLDRLPSPEAFADAIAHAKALRQSGVECDSAYWNGTSAKRTDLEQLRVSLAAECARLRSEPAWFRECVESGFYGENSFGNWVSLIRLIEQTCEVASQAYSAALDQQVHELPTGWDMDELQRISKEIEEHLRNRGGIGAFKKMLKPDWARLADRKIDGRHLKSADDFGAVALLATTELKRRELTKRWQIQLKGLDAELPPEAINRPEEFLRQFIPRIKDALNWFEQAAAQFENSFGDLEICWQEVVNRQQQLAGSHPTLMRWLNAAEALAPVLLRRIQLLDLKHIQRLHAELLGYLRSFGGDGHAAPTTLRLIAAVNDGDCGTYATSVLRLRALHSLFKQYCRRKVILEKLQIAAPGWADAVARRVSPHDCEVSPGDAQRAWRFRQWTQELDRRASTDIDLLQREVNAFSDRLQEMTAQYVVASTWAEQRRTRYGSKLRQSLNGYANTVSKPGFEGGVRSSALKAQAREQLKSARAAVPVWIMPLSRVVESFDFSSTLFDLVVIDEASQCDVVGILPLMLSNSVFVVGDKEQVSPLAIGEKGREIQSLINQFLYDIPNKENYDGRASIYDLAKESFETPTCLVEHFRCVPEIIQFSNDLCYEGKIKPLRESHDVVTRPFLVAHRVLNGVADNKVNNVEATEIASLVVAATEQPEYDGMTMGVISLVGIEQAVLIDMLLRRQLPETEYANRRLLCGNAAEFQGDERHVMFLSVVDSSDGTPLPKRQTDLFKQRFNVAASRAQNQLWVVHSLNPDTELQAGDLRSRLIQHAQDPTALTNQLSQANKLAQSEFEKQVIRRLTQKNFRIASQWQVGAFSIDIVVFGNNEKKVAIECDGDRYHTIANLEDDNRRQLMLERLGWRFIRIRSSRFFRDPDAAMAVVFERLEQLEIEAIGPETPDDTKQQASSELKDRVIRRAEELRHEWKEQEALESPRPIQRPVRRRKFSTNIETPKSTEPTKSAAKAPQKSLFDLETDAMPTPSPPSPLPSPLPTSAAAAKSVSTAASTDSNREPCPKCKAGQLTLKQIKLYNGVRKFRQCSKCNYSKDG